MGTVLAWAIIISTTLLPRGLAETQVFCYVGGCEVHGSLRTAHGWLL